MCEAVQQVTGQTIELAWAYEGYTGEHTKQDARAHGIGHQAAQGQERLRAVARRWVIKRGFGWLARFRRLSHDYDRLSGVLRGFHFLIF